MYKFRPQSYSKVWALKNRIRTGNISCGDLNWHPHTRDDQRRWILKFFGILHYYTSHAPSAVSARWQQASRRWDTRYTKNASFRYIKTRSIERNI